VSGPAGDGAADQPFVPPQGGAGGAGTEGSGGVDALAPPAAGGRRGAGEVILEVSDLRVTFPTSEGDVHAVRGVDFALAAGETLGVVGESGSGKTVTSMAALGLLPKRAVVEGSIRFLGRELVGADEATLRTVRGDRVAMVFQDALTALNPVYTVGDQIAEMISSHQDVRKSDLRDRVVDLLELVGIPQPAARADQYPHEFSGGMRQRAMIAMAIANEPDLLIADEPTTALDVTVQAQVLEVLQRIQDRTKSSILLITHDLGVVAGVADRVMVMYAGRSVEVGSVDEAFYSPLHPYTRGLLDSLPRLDQAGGGSLRRIAGNPPSLLNLPPGCAFWPRCPHAQRGRCDATDPVLEGVGGDRSVACLRHAELPEWQR
jgi:oligopeptide/dipeptide ABC transporter ATP-binding protein